MKCKTCRGFERKVARFHEVMTEAETQYDLARAMVSESSLVRAVAEDDVPVMYGAITVLEKRGVVEARAELEAAIERFHSVARKQMAHSLSHQYEH